jgi:hypothetical protein
MKKENEVRIDTGKAREDRFRLITGYDEIDDSTTIGKVYPHQELVDSIQYLKMEREYLNGELEKLKYSIDSLQKLR